MFKLKHSILALVSAAALCGAGTASASSFELWNGSAWVNSGTVTFTGSTTASYLGIGVPCSANFTVNLAGGVATVTAASFSGSAACSGIVASNLPWSMVGSAYSGANPPFAGAPTLTPTLWTVAITGVRIYIPAPLNVNCPSPSGSGTVSGVLDQTVPNKFVFKSALGPCSVQTQNNLWLSPNFQVRVLLP